jgi:hypothetical protein
VRHRYPIIMFSLDKIQVGCEMRSKDEWLSLSTKELRNMGGQDAVEFYPHLVEYLEGL